jgi:class 3 adenylate cyclase
VDLRPQDGNVAEVQKMAMRGLRLKVGMATGVVMDYISSATARIMYRGRVMNWAARISHLATGGQVGALAVGCWLLAGAIGWLSWGRENSLQVALYVA